MGGYPILVDGKEKNMKFIHIADIHLGVTEDGTNRWQSLKQVMERAEAERVDFLLIAGDLFHGQPLMRDLKRFAELGQNLSKTQVILMAGNHDHLQPRSNYLTFQWPDNIHFFQQEVWCSLDFPKVNTCIYGMSYWHKELPETEGQNITIKNTGRINLLLMHGGDAKHQPFSPEKLAGAGFDYVACGHIHKSGRLLGDTVIMAGSLEPVKISDTGVHGYWMGEINGTQKKVEFFPIQNLEYVECQAAVTPSMGREALREKIGLLLEHKKDYQKLALTIKGRYHMDEDLGLEELEQLQGISSLNTELMPDYDFAELKERYRGQFLGRYLKALESIPEDRIREKAMYYGTDAILKADRE